MKRIVLLMLMASMALAQQQMAPTTPPSPPSQVAATNVAERAHAPTYSDVNCAGFVTNQAVPADNYVAGGWATPDQTKHADRDYLYLTGGGFQEGARYSIVRRLQDPNKSEYFSGQKALLSGIGQPYADMGRVLVIGVNGNTAITQVEFSCDSIMPGDIAVPFAAREIPTFRNYPKFDRFAPPNGKLTGQIVMAQEFDTLLGTGRKVYLSVGGNQGVKVGDYFRAVRTYPTTLKDKTDSLPFKASYAEDTQKNETKLSSSRLGEFPRRNLGEMIVLGVTPSSSTAMVTFALEDIHLGDGVEMMEPPPPPMNPPSISCNANPATIRPGESSTITCEGSSADNRPLQYAFASTGGQLVQRDNVGTLTGSEPGAISVKATVTDDRNLSSVALTTVNVEAPPAAPTANKTNEIAFKNSSAYVDNRAKAVLDDIALRLQQDPNSSTTLVGYADPSERGAKTLAARRAANAATYLTKTKGIDPGRVHTSTSTEPGAKADIWMVPAGAQMPQ